MPSLAFFDPFRQPILSSSHNFADPVMDFRRHFTLFTRIEP